MSSAAAEDENAKPEIEIEIDAADKARDCYEKWRDEVAQRDAQAILDAQREETLGTRGGQKRKRSRSSLSDF